MRIEYGVACHYDNAGTGGQLTGTGRFKRNTGPGLPVEGGADCYPGPSF
jgi:hypothetical protein